MEQMAANTRTLIVCFVAAIMVLIPLRFVEEGQLMVQRAQKQAKVLGQQSEAQKEEERQGGIELESPYEQMEQMEREKREDCLSPGTALRLIEVITAELAEGDYTQKQAEGIDRAVKEIEGRICR